MGIAEEKKKRRAIVEERSFDQEEEDNFEMKSRYQTINGDCGLYHKLVDAAVVVVVYCRL